MTKLFALRLRAKRSRRSILTGIGLVAVASLIALTLARSSEAAATAVYLGDATSFAVLAGSGITNTGATTVNGDLGTFPTTTFTGAGSVTINGTNHAGDSVTQDAKNSLVTAYNDAAGQGPKNPIVADLGGQVLSAGVYNSASSIGLTGVLTLNGGGNTDAIFVFQAGSALTTAGSSSVVLTNGARSCNVFWQVGSSATLGTNSTFVGSLIALSSITVTTGATVDGRVLARNGAVTLDTNTITKPSCSASIPAGRPGGAALPSPDRTIYCLGGTAYNLIIGQDKLPPYDVLGLTPAFIDPVTGAKTCTASTPPTATTPTATTPTATTPTPTPTPKPKPKPKKVAVAKARRIAVAKAAPKPKPAITTAKFGFTG